MKALIIGGAGFVGKYLINELADKEYQVSATCLQMRLSAAVNVRSIIWYTRPECCS